MLAGTFNLVMAERLVRKVCDHCKNKVSIKDDPKFSYARESFRNFDKELLKKEVVSRNISEQQWNDFINDGFVSIGTGKDPQTG
jgi:type II secretory ATPase GspE/PulE/Tfp pilus assembly ATPase PilB-like protein